MKPLFSSSTKRSTAFVVLLVWLFALASGVANACLIQAKEINRHGSLAAYSSAAEKGHAASAVLGDPIPKYDFGFEASKSQCLKVCDDGSQSLPKQPVGFDWTHPDPAPLPAVTWATATPVASAHSLAVFQRPPDPGLPIRVRLSRLAL